ncbi:hypothetical protein Bbelb_048650 [Branchiostoma belcheri]|nr:hypothetical protein Bbelb_048650 [Branchiostoma belcheri]
MGKDLEERVNYDLKIAENPEVNRSGRDPPVTASADRTIMVVSNNKDSPTVLRCLYLIKRACTTGQIPATVATSERMDIITMLWSAGVQSEASVHGGHCEVRFVVRQARGDCDKKGVFAWHIGLVISQVFIRIKHLSIHTRNTEKT